MGIPPVKKSSGFVNKNISNPWKRGGGETPIKNTGCSSYLSKNGFGTPLGVKPQKVHNKGFCSTFEGTKGKFISNDRGGDEDIERGAPKIFRHSKGGL